MTTLPVLYNSHKSQFEVQGGYQADARQRSEAHLDPDGDLSTPVVHSKSEIHLLNNQQLLNKRSAYFNLIFGILILAS